LKIQVYLKLVFIATLTSIFFGEQLVLAPHKIASEWIYGIVSLMLVLLGGTVIYLTRKAVKTLLLTSKSKNFYGAMLLLASLVLYLAKTYVQFVFPNLLFTFSLSLFVASLITFLLDYRIVREFPLIFVALPFVLPPADLSTCQIVEFRLASYFLGIVALTGLTFGLIKTFRKKTDRKCPFCSSTKNKEEFCPFCGKQLLPPTTRVKRTDIVKILAITFLVSILLYSYIPVSVLGENGAEVKKYAWSEVENESILVVPEGWILSESKRLIDYETQNQEDFASLYLYQRSHNYSSLLLEIGPREPYLMNHWQIPGWQRKIFSENIRVTDQVYGKCYVLKEINQVRGRFIALRSIVVLRLRTLTYLFNENGVFTAKKVGISVFTNFSRPVKDLQVILALEDLSKVAASAVNRLQYLSSWTSRVSTFNQIYLVSKESLLSVSAVIILFLIAWFVRHRDHEVGEIIDRYASLNKNEVALLLMAFKMRKLKFKGKQLFENLPENTKANLKIDEFYLLLKKLENKGFLKRDLILEGTNIVTVWSPIV